MRDHPPIPVTDLADNIDRLKANDGLKFSQEYEVSVGACRAAGQSPASRGFGQTPSGEGSGAASDASPAAASPAWAPSQAGSLPALPASPEQWERALSAQSMARVGKRPNAPQHAVLPPWLQPWE